MMDFGSVLAGLTNLQILSGVLGHRMAVMALIAGFFPPLWRRMKNAILEGHDSEVQEV